MSENSSIQNFRIGQGVDVHAFGVGEHVMLCGVKIPHSAGLVAHSDGDVALHALCDALLGAAALGDIGKHFPPHDSAFENANSRHLLGSVVGLISEHGWVVNNADITLICEAPRIGPHVHEMQLIVASGLNVSSDSVSIKATTTEGLGFCGREEGIAAMAVVLLTSRSAS
ncbi:MAG: 2-C-methyl-D-erythritol 2,4-cyclodiphosphate synthase [Lysobacterales bacterium]|jgi:2-C-methyl-D-erythritol 2,4-cyclodiphosphate synthase